MKKFFMTMASVVLSTSSISGLTAFMKPSPINNSVKNTVIKVNPAQQIINKITNNAIIVSKNINLDTSNFNTDMAIRLSLQYNNSGLTQLNINTLSFGQISEQTGNIKVTSTVGQYQACVDKYLSFTHPEFMSMFASTATSLAGFPVGTVTGLTYTLSINTKFLWWTMAKHNLAQQLWAESYVYISNAMKWVEPFNYLGGNFSARKTTYISIFSDPSIIKSLQSMKYTLHHYVVIMGGMYRFKDSQSHFGGDVTNII